MDTLPPDAPLLGKYTSMPKEEERDQWFKGIQSVKTVATGNPYTDLEILMSCYWVRCQYKYPGIKERETEWRMFQDPVDVCIEEMAKKESNTDPCQEIALTTHYLAAINAWRDEPGEVSFLSFDIGDHCLYHWQRAQACLLKLEQGTFHCNKKTVHVADALYRAGYLSCALTAIAQITKGSNLRQEWLEMVKKDLVRMPDYFLNQEQLLERIDRLLSQEVCEGTKKENSMKSKAAPRDTTPLPKRPGDPFTSEVNA